MGAIFTSSGFGPLSLLLLAFLVRGIISVAGRLPAPLCVMTLAADFGLPRTGVFER